MLIGIDYGSKLAGTTVVATWLNGNIELHQSQKKQDADKMLENVLAPICEETIVAFDAPLSLPGVYRQLNGFSNFHYRKCDVELKAMSPMFLGGLTARAMSLAHKLSNTHVTFYETYPAKQAQRLNLSIFDYKKPTANYDAIREVLTKALNGSYLPKLTNGHQVDAVLALITAYRIQEKEAQIIGDAAEGVIYF